MKKTVRKAKPEPKTEAHKSPVLTEVSKLYEFMQKNGLETIDYQDTSSHVRLVRKRAQPVHVPVPVAAHGAPVQGQKQASSAPAPSEYHGDTLKSPLMGIFFRAPSPSSPPFVREGEFVKAGQVMCLIEAMKVFNEVKAEYDCILTKVLVEDGKPVKQGQDLLAIERK